MRHANNRPARRKGFSLIVALFLTVMMAMSLAVFNRMAGDAQFDWNRAYADACARNLAASGLAWGRLHPQTTGGDIVKTGKVHRDLDVSALGIPNGKLCLTAELNGQGQLVFQVNTAVPFANRVFPRTERYLAQPANQGTPGVERQ